MDPSPQVASPDPERRKRLRRHMILGLAILAAASVAVLALVPVHYGFSGTVTTANCLSCGGNGSGFPGGQLPGSVQITFPDRASVTLHWQTTNGSNVSLWIYPSSGSLNDSRQTCYSTGAPVGTCQFVSIGGSYSILVVDALVAEPVETVVFSGTYTSPVLAL